MDDIPVKIIEKYKPPKKIALPGVLLHKPTSSALKNQVIKYNIFLNFLFSLILIFFIKLYLHLIIMFVIV